MHDETTFLHDEDGAPMLLQGVIFDITERKLAEQALRESEQRERDAAERLRALDEMKNTFLAAVSHELRSPLTAILGLSLTLERGPSMVEADRIGPAPARLATNARKLDRLLKDLLDIDRLNRGIVEPQYRVTDVGALARRTVESLDMLADRDVVVEAEPVVIAIDPAKVERIIENLLMNAARHTTADRRDLAQGARHTTAACSCPSRTTVPACPTRSARPSSNRSGRVPPPRPTRPAPGSGCRWWRGSRSCTAAGPGSSEREGGGASFRVFLPGRPGPALADGDGSMPDGDDAYERADVG